MSFIKNGSAILSRHLIQHTTYVQLLECLRGNVLENQRGKNFQDTTYTQSLHVHLYGLPVFFQQ